MHPKRSFIVILKVFWAIYFPFLNLIFIFLKLMHVHNSKPDESRRTNRKKLQSPNLSLCHSSWE